MLTRYAIVLTAAAAFLTLPLDSAPNVPLYQRFLSPASPQELVAARKADKIAWVDYAEGRRNAYAAAGPLFVPVKLSNFTKDDGIMMSEVKISDDGSTVIFLRGETEPRRWAPNPSADPNGPEHAFWAAKTTGVGGAWRVARTNPELAPDGSSLLFVKDGQIYRAKISPVKPASEVDRGEKAFIREWGVQSAPRWSPDGRKIAFVSTRTDHSFIVVYDVATRTVKYMSPGVDFDTKPMWMADSKHLIFMRRPGLPFGQQARQGPGAFGLPNGPARGRLRNGRRLQDAAGGRWRKSRRWNGGRGNGGQGNQARRRCSGVTNNSPGIMQATFKGGYTLAFYKADVTTADAQEVWHNQPNDHIAANIANARLAGNFVIYQFNPGGRSRRARRKSRRRDSRKWTRAEPAARGAQPVDEFERYYSLNVSDSSARPVLLTTTDGLIEDRTSTTLSPDGKTFFYCTNAKDIERRHIWAVPVGGGTPVEITTGEGVETYPAPLASGKFLATISANWNLPQSVGIWKMGPSLAAAPPQKIVFPTSRPGFPDGRAREARNRYDQGCRRTRDSQSACSCRRT